MERNSEQERQLEQQQKHLEPQETQETLEIDQQPSNVNEISHPGEQKQESDENSVQVADENKEVPILLEAANEPVTSLPNKIDATNNDKEANQLEHMDVTLEEMNTSLLHPPLSQNQFATPLKSLPPLKDIDNITTPKSFNVAKDIDHAEVASSPIITHPPQNPSTAVGNTMAANADSLVIVSNTLNVAPEQVNALDPTLFRNLVKLVSEYEEVKSANGFLKINQEQIAQIQEKNFKSLQQKLEALDKKNILLSNEKEDLSVGKIKLSEMVDQLKKEKESLESRLSNTEQDKARLDSRHNEGIAQRDEEIAKLSESSSNLMKSNIEQNQKLNEVTKELNESRNEKFALKLELTKILNELSYIKNQKLWYEEELKSVQQRFTDLIKKHESEFLIDSNRISSLTTKNNTLERLNSNLQKSIEDLQKKLEGEISKTSSLSSKLEIEKFRLSKELKNKEELLELTKVQSSQRSERVSQLESYVDEIKESLGETNTMLENEITKKDEVIATLEEKLRRTEDVLDKELHKGTDLPKLSASAELIASNNSERISLSALYSEYNHLKKQVILERSQKDKLAQQLESFIAELESKKPALATYRDQIKFYENSLNDLIAKIEELNTFKSESERECSRLKSRLTDNNNELSSLKKLCRDLGRQLCFYLIHSKIRDSNESPLTANERKAIENILERSGNKEDIKESDTDQLISERLVSFASIIELQQKNSELLTVVRQLGSKIEAKEEYATNLESSAIEEAKDAILTLQGELDSLNIKLVTVTKERDVLKALSDPNGTSINKGEVAILNNENKDLKMKLNTSEEILKELQIQSAKTIKELNEKLNEITNAKVDLSIKISSAQNSVNLSEARFANAQRSLENSQVEISQLRKDVEFWKAQCSKQESQLINKSNELRDVECVLSGELIKVNNLKNEKEMWLFTQKSLNEDINQLRIEKSQLSEFVLNLQSLIKEREASGKDLSIRLDQSIQNYQALQKRLNDKEERITILCNQSELAFKAQNSKLEQVNNLSQQLLDAKSEMAKKKILIEKLGSELDSLKKGRASQLDSFKGFNVRTENDSNSSNDSNIEIESLRDSLRIAELQVSELSAIAKAAEDALVQSNNTFESFKNECDERIASLNKEKDALTRELSDTKELWSSTNNEMKKSEASYQVQIQELKVKMQESLMKAESCDKLQFDCDQKIKAVLNDLKSQSEIANNNQQKYQDEHKKNEELTSQLMGLREDCSKFKNEIHILTQSLDNAKASADLRSEALDEEKRSLSQQLEETKLKLKDLQEQNKLMLNQLELSKLPSSGVSDSSSLDDLKHIISYLRREKDSAQTKLDSHLRDHQRLSSRLERVSSELEMTKSELVKLKASSVDMDQNKKEHEKSLELLQQLNILRESNTTLRNENSVNIAKINDLNLGLQSAHSRLAPLEKQVEELSIQIDIKDQTIKLVSEENNNFKAKLQANLSAASTDATQEELNAMKQRFTNLKNEFQNKLLANRGKTKELEKTVESLKSELSNAEKEARKIKEKSESNASLSGELEKAKKEMSDTNNLLNNLKNELENRTERLKSEKLLLENQVNDLQEKIDSLQSQTGSDNKENFDKELAKMKEKYESEISDLKLSLEADFNKKLKEETEKMSQAYNNGTFSEKEAELRQSLESQFKEKYSQLERESNESKFRLEEDLKQKFDQELNSKIEAALAKMPQPNQESGHQDHSELIAQHEAEIKKLKEDFEEQLNKVREDTKNVTEKKFEIKLRMLNKKLDRLEATKNTSNPNNNSVSNLATIENLSTQQNPTSLPQVPEQANAAVNQEKPKMPLGHQFTESTLTVHRPAVERSNSPPNRGAKAEAKTGQKRPHVNKGQNANKRPKE